MAPPNISRRLVIADDSAEMRWVVRSTIGDDFHEVVEARDGRELVWALMRTLFRWPDDDVVVVTDLRMPSYDGLQVLDAWHEMHPGLATVMITAFPTDEVQQRARALGIKLLAKPFSTAQLKSAMREVAHGHRSL